MSSALQGRLSPHEVPVAGSATRPAAADLRANELLIARQLRRALRAGAIAVHYQPVVELPSGRIVGAEALARWNDELLGTVTPDVFIGVAERAGLIEELGAHVLRTACAEAATWTPAAPDVTGPSVSVNVSALQLRTDDIVSTVQHALAAAGLAATRLCLEITETAAVQDLPGCTERLTALRALGVRIALDDFGTGHSSLTLLRRLPVDIVKIDRSFVEQVTADARDAVLVRLLIDAAHSFGLRICAEGVETREQARQLVAMGADRAQGWLFGRPEAGSPALTARLTGPAREGVDDTAAPKLLLGGNEELVVVTGPDYRIRYISAALHAMLGYLPNQAVGASVLTFLESDSLVGPHRPEPGVLVGNGRYQVRHRDGSLRWLHSRGQQLADIGGRGAEFLFVVRDVTDAVRAERALAESEAKFREAFDGAPIGMAINRLDGSFLDVNQALAELLGYTTEQMLAMTVADITCPEDQAGDVANTEALLAGTVRHVSVDKRYLDVHGRQLAVRVRASIVTDDGTGQAYIVAHVLPRGSAS
ncbi:MAG TPA: EAL domain-containing protein [Jatrophihabitans sp.]|nr:EAL domain-containing protein [Jatrophihabitans sp.]